MTRDCRPIVGTGVPVHIIITQKYRLIKLTNELRGPLLHMDVIDIVNLLCEVNFSHSCLYQNHIA